ncbi:RAMP superfamily CRISPR-associated protein [Crocosphaera sp. XPORK-15E]|nr:RAMP superfamily CRISPR-associated protein [Crocosphaera sp. XPORK-15E]
MAKALQKAYQEKGEDIEVPTIDEFPETDPERIPMMYRAQIGGRCSLQYARDNTHLERWLKEWINPNPNTHQPSHQIELPPLGLDGHIYRFQSYPFFFRVISDCGQDSIIRPLINNKGIPFIPGSSIKGLFERLTRSQQISQELVAKVKEYCGSPDTQGSLRFHGAYPIGDWAGTFLKNSNSLTQNQSPCYRITDVVHPQQEKQVNGKFKTTAIASISLYQPTLIFELSSIYPLGLDEWKNIEGLLKRALRQGLGGKTSTGYGLSGNPQNQSSLWLLLEGNGVSSQLRNGVPEFRPNLFKATLRGHTRRLLSGVCQKEKTIKDNINSLFGSSKGSGNFQIYWESKSLDDQQNHGKEKTQIYQTKGILYLDAPPQEQKLLEWVVKFAYIMGGFGKSWRRVYHPLFKSNYKERAIGCHWKCLDSEPELIIPKSVEELKTFLLDLHQFCQQYLKPDNSKSSPDKPDKEAWNPKRLSVYSQIVSTSQAIDLFHDENFKTTPAIGGRKEGDKSPTSVSYVWHRMLPINGTQYLEIMTIFIGDDSPKNDPWVRMSKEGKETSQLIPFIKALENKGLKWTWGKKFS